MLEEKIKNFFNMYTFFIIAEFIGWFIITTIFAINDDNSKNDVIFRYAFTFTFQVIFTLVLIYFWIKNLFIKYLNKDIK